MARRKASKSRLLNQMANKSTDESRAKIRSSDQRSIGSLSIAGKRYSDPCVNPNTKITLQVDLIIDEKKLSFWATLYQ